MLCEDNSQTNVASVSVTSYTLISPSLSIHHRELGTQARIYMASYNRSELQILTNHAGGRSMRS